MRFRNLEELRRLFSIRDALASYDSLEALLQNSVRVVHEQTRSQTASIFLFSKDGMLERRALVGTDKYGNPIPKEWFSDESYAIGGSFTGKVTVPKGATRFGEPQWTMRPNQDHLDQQSFDNYFKKLGSLSCAAAVPLNGAHRTFGVLEIINKCDSDGQPQQGFQFSLEDLYWLSVIGLTTAFAITILRHKDRLALQTLISHIIPRPLLGVEEPQTAYELIAKELTGALTSYKACIIRVGAGRDMLEITARGGPAIDWDGRIEPPGHPGTLYGQVLTTGDKIIIEDIEAHADKFTNLKWIRANRLRSYACFPLTLKTQVVGAIGLYAGYLKAFEESDIAFIESTCFLLACLAESFHLAGKLHLDDKIVEEEKISILSGVQAVAATPTVIELNHRQKNFLVDIGKGLRDIREESSGRIARLIDEQISLIDAEILTEVKQLGTAVHSRVSINPIAQRVVRYFSRELRTKDISFSFDRGEIPDIEASEAEIKAVLVNLVDNAVKAIHATDQRNGYVRISTQTFADRREWIEIEIEDNGCGIRNEHIDSIFNDGFSTRGGTGKGLFIAKAIVVQNYDGDILVDSAVGRGSTFTVRLPLKRLRWSR